MYNKDYYDGKKKKLQDKFQKVKDAALQEFINLNSRLVGDINEINQELAEIDNILKGNSMENEQVDAPEAIEVTLGTVQEVEPTQESTAEADENSKTIEPSV